MRGRQKHLSRLVVSAGKKETALNNEIMPDTLFLVQPDSFLKSGKSTEKEEVLAGGQAEPARLYKFGGEASGPFSPGKMQPQHLAFLAAFAMGDVTTVPAGAAGYLHTITPLTSPLDAKRDLPTTTAVQRVGTLFKRCYAGIGVDSFTLGFKRKDWVTVSGQLKGTGKTQINLITETAAGNSDDASVTLANAAQGADAAARLDSVHQVRFKLDSGGGYGEVNVRSVSDASPAVVTIDPPDSTGTNPGTYEIVYVPAESAELDSGSATSDPAWDAINEQGTLTDSAATMTPAEHAGRWLVMTSGTASGAMFQIQTNTATAFTFDGYDPYGAGARSADTYKVVQFGWANMESIAKVSETPMYVDQTVVYLGGDYNGTSFTGGRKVRGEAESVEWSYNNSLEAGFLAGDRNYAGSLEKGQPEQTLKLDRKMLDAVLQAMMETVDGLEAEYFAIKLSGEGAEYESGYTYYWEVVFPKCALLNAEPSLGGEKINESAEVAILSHETHGSVVVKVRNKVATYAA